MPQLCQQCSDTFVITETDQAFYKKIDVPEPTLCPPCRSQRRLAWRNERSFYHRTCDFSQKPIISLYASESPYKIYDQQIWWSDQWNPKEYGQDFDFSRPFFEQFHELALKVPKMSMMVDSRSENSNYSPYLIASKNCYLCVGGGYMEDCYYCTFCRDSKNTIDSAFSRGMELCYECVNSHDCYQVSYAQNSTHCRDSALLFDCHRVSNSFGCAGLVNKEYHIFNQSVTKEEFQEKMREVFSSELKWKQAAAQFEEIKKQIPKRDLYGTQNEQCTGNYVYQSKNSSSCFDSIALEDCAYCSNATNGRDNRDIDYLYGTELCYQSCSVVNGYGCIGADVVWDSRNIFYSSYCFYSNDLFGCLSLKHDKYCILNKQYEKEEYEELKAQIIEHMKKTGEWGEFFPVSIAPFPYHDALASEYFPLSRDEVLSRGWNWTDKEKEVITAEKLIPAEKLPYEVSKIPDDILNWAIECEVTKRPFKIIKQELDFYRRFNLPIPRCHPDQRQHGRMSLRSPRRLWPRNCSNCSKEIQTTYSPERTEKVYCEECYLKEVY